MRVSVIIPVKNGSSTLRRCLSAIRAQTLKDLEIVVLDSGSTDDSREIATGFGARVVDIAPGNFNHGLTRNVGMHASQSELLFYTVQDAWIEDERLLQKMVQHFDDPLIQAVTGHQAIPPGHFDKNPALWFKRISAPVIERRSFGSGDVFKKLPVQEQFTNSSWDNVIAMYRKEALIEVPFRQTNYSEDWQWANDALKNGFSILRDPSLVIYHYHHQKFSYSFKTHVIVSYQFYKIFDVLPTLSCSPLPFARAANSIVRKQELPVAKKFYWIAHNAVMFFARFLAALLFRLAYFFSGRKGVDALYNKVSRQIPQGRQKD